MIQKDINLKILEKLKISQEEQKSNFNFIICILNLIISEQRVNMMIHIY
jgi:hypothetical protein